MATPQDPSFFCDKMDLWAKAYMTPLETDDKYKAEERVQFAKHWNYIRLAISKSNLLHRLFYGGEDLRTEECPIHKGKWSGCKLPKEMECKGVCADGFNVTGWLKPTGAAEAKS